MRILKCTAASIFCLFSAYVFGLGAILPYRNTGKVEEWVMRVDMGGLALICLMYAFAVWYMSSPKPLASNYTT